MKHTPGPWKFTGRNGIGEQVRPYVNCEITPENSSGWKDGRYMCVSRAIDENDARLIAAAPELLEALQACVDYAISGGDEWVAEKARAAIAKATGEQP